MRLQKIIVKPSELAYLKGIIRVSKFRRGKLLWTVERSNLVVTAHNVPTSKLLGGTGTLAADSITAIGFGSGTTAPAITDTALTTPAYYKTLASVSYPSAGQVQFSWALGGSDNYTPPNGMTIGEIGLFCNTGGVNFASPPVSGTPSLTLFAHALLGLGTFNYASDSYTGTWTIVC